MDIAQGEKVEGELDTFIERRHEQRVRDEGERAELEAWRASERRKEARRREENRLAWHDWHCEQAERHRRTLEHLVAYHE